MYISAVTGYKSLVNPAVTRGTFQRTPDLSNDVFVKSANVTFMKATSAGNPLRKLKNITCPYTGIKMISGSDVYPFDRKLSKCKDLCSIIKLLSKYQRYMQPVEKKMFSLFSEYASCNPRGNLQDCIRKMYNDSMTKLKLEEFMVLDKVDALSQKLTPKTALELRKKTTRCREVIIANDAQDTFKRKTFLTSLDEIKPKEDEKEIFEKMKEQALYLPTSSSSENAFVVKYINRSQNEIARRLFIASTATIEHVTPNSKGGANSIGNFMLASANGNRARENMPLTKYISRFPKIPEYCQQYINEVIRAIHKGELKGCETYPYQIQRKLVQESEGKIILDLSKYRYTEEQAQKKSKEILNRKYKKRRG